jgi:hypothetical protein
MNDATPWSEAVAEVRRRVDEGRANGLYPEELDAQLASQFARAAKDPLYFEGLDRFGQDVEKISGVRFSASQIPTSSDVAGGVLQQVDAYATGVGVTFRSLVTGLEELRSVVTNDVFGDIDAVHHRLVALEHRLARLEAAQPGDESSSS